MALTFRDNKGSALSYTEMDSNFRYFTGSYTNAGTITATAFAGDGSAITGVTAEWDGSHTGDASITGSLVLSGSGIGLNVLGNITASGHISASGNLYAVMVNAEEIQGTIATATQIQITSVGSLNSITSTGNSILGNAITDTHTFEGHITASGNISASGDLHFSSSLSSNTGYKTLVYDTSTGKVYYTGSYGGGGGGSSLWYDGTTYLSSSLPINVLGDITASGNIIQGLGESYPTTFHGAEYISVAIGNNCYPNPTAGARYNVALGRNALRNATTAQQSCAIGDSTLRNVTNGNYNNALGFGCLNGIETGSYNIGIGHQALFYNHNIEGNTAIGYRAMMGNDNNDECTYNTALGYHAGYYVGSGSKNVMIGYQCVDDNYWKNSNTVYVGAGCVPSAVAGIENENVFGYATTGGGSNSVRIGNTSVTSIGGDAAWTDTSDLRIKRNIQSGSLGLDFINKLNPVIFQKVNPSEYPEEIIERRYTERTQWDPETSSSITTPADPPPLTDNSWYDGLIAQEVSASLSELGVESNIWDKDPKGKQGIKYGILTIPLIKAVQELSAKVTALEAQISGSL